MKSILYTAEVSSLTLFKCVKIANIYSSIHIYIAIVYIYSVYNEHGVRWQWVWTEGGTHPETRQYSWDLCYFCHLEGFSRNFVNTNGSLCPETREPALETSDSVDWETNFVSTVTGYYPVSLRDKGTLSGFKTISTTTSKPAFGYKWSRTFKVCSVNWKQSRA